MMFAFLLLLVGDLITYAVAGRWVDWPFLIPVAVAWPFIMVRLT